MVNMKILAQTGLQQKSRGGNGLKCWLIGITSNGSNVEIQEYYNKIPQYLNNFSLAQHNVRQHNFNISPAYLLLK